jgi:hypothetical protein
VREFSFHWHPVLPREQGGNYAKGIQDPDCATYRDLGVYPLSPKLYLISLSASEGKSQVQITGCDFGVSPAAAKRLECVLLLNCLCVLCAIKMESLSVAFRSALCCQWAGIVMRGGQGHSEKDGGVPAEHGREKGTTSQWLWEGSGAEVEVMSCEKQVLHDRWEGTGPWLRSGRGNDRRGKQFPGGPTTYYVTLG